MLFAVSSFLFSVTGTQTVTGQWIGKSRWHPMEGNSCNYVRQFQSLVRSCTSVLISQATFYPFLTRSLKNKHKTSFGNREMDLQISNLFPQNQPELQVIILTKINSRTYQSKLLWERFVCTKSLSSLDNLANLLGHTTLADPFKYLTMQISSRVNLSERFFRVSECFGSRAKRKLRHIIHHTKSCKGSGTDLADRVGAWNWRTKLPSLGGHIGFTFFSD